LLCDFVMGLGSKTVVSYFAIFIATTSVLVFFTVRVYMLVVINVYDPQYAMLANMLPLPIFMVPFMLQMFANAFMFGVYLGRKGMPSQVALGVYFEVLAIFVASQAIACYFIALHTYSHYSDPSRALMVSVVLAGILHRMAFFVLVRNLMEDLIGDCRSLVALVLFAYAPVSYVYTPLHMVSTAILMLMYVFIGVDAERRGMGEIKNIAYLQVLILLMFYFPGILYMFRYPVLSLIFFMLLPKFYTIAGSIMFIVLKLKGALEFE